MSSDAAEHRFTHVPPFRGDVVGAVRDVLMGAAAGAAGGLLVGGIGGRLAMLALRLTSPGTVRGVVSDDGFEIGVVSLQTIQLLAAGAGLGALCGCAYAVVRGLLPARLRVMLWGVAGAAIGGAAIVEPDGVDFTLLRPAWLAVTLFVVLPGAGAALIALLTDRLSRVPGDRLVLGAVAPVALLGTVATLAALPPAVVALAVGRALRRHALAGDGAARSARVAVTLLVVAAATAGTVALVRAAVEIL